MGGIRHGDLSSFKQRVPFYAGGVAAAPVGSGHLVELCARELGWKKSTTYTVLKKMCEKGLLQNENSTVAVLIPQEAVTAEAAGEFVNKAFGGSPAGISRRLYEWPEADGGRGGGFETAD